MSAQYDASYLPPIPVLQVTLVSDTGARSRLLTAIVDTGADATIVPEALLLEIQATPVEPGQIKTQWGEVHPVTVYLLDVQVEKILLPGMLVAGDPTTDEIVLGRNVLNKLPLFLDGPAQRTELLDDATVKRLRARRE